MGGLQTREEEPAKQKKNDEERGIASTLRKRKVGGEIARTEKTGQGEASVSKAFPAERGRPIVSYKASGAEVKKGGGVPYAEKGMGKGVRNRSTRGVAERAWGDQHFSEKNGGSAPTAQGMSAKRGAQTWCHGNKKPRTDPRRITSVWYGIKESQEAIPGGVPGC